MVLNEPQIVGLLTEAEFRLDASTRSTTLEGGIYNASRSIAASNLIIVEYLRRLNERCK